MWLCSCRAHETRKRLHTWDLFEDNQKRLHTWASLVKKKIGKSENEKSNEKNIFLSCDSAAVVFFVWFSFSDFPIFFFTNEAQVCSLFWLSSNKSQVCSLFRVSLARQLQSHMTKKYFFRLIFHFPIFQFFFSPTNPKYVASFGCLQTNPKYVASFVFRERDSCRVTWQKNIFFVWFFISDFPIFFFTNEAQVCSLFWLSSNKSQVCSLFVFR